MKHKVAAIQLHPLPMNMADNYARAASHIRATAQQGCSLAVLPEYCLTGWVPKDPRFGEVAEDRSYLIKFQELAKECNINIVPGTLVEKHINEGKEMLYNVAYFIDNKGMILGRYIKKNLWHPERKFLEAGVDDEHRVIETSLGKVGLLICWDLAFPETFRALIIQGAEIIIVPAFWTMNSCTPKGLRYNPESEAVFLKSTLVSRAYENTCCVVFANAGGKRERDYAGLSMITMPFIGPIAQAEGTDEQIIIGEIDMEILEEAEHNYKVRYDLTRPGFHYAANI